MCSFFNLFLRLAVLSVISLFLVCGELFAGTIEKKGRIEIQNMDDSEEYVDEDEPVAAIRRPLPVYLSQLSNLNDYCIFANGGWDGNWYVGFNVCWIEEMPIPPEGNYVRAYVGAKLGRAKTRVVSGKPGWEKEAIPGDIYVSLSSTPAWRSSQKYFLTDTGDIPLEGDAENALEGVGESRWFWTEVPVNAVSPDSPSYIALWSPTDFLMSTSSSPILAGGWGSQKVNSWLNNDVFGYAPLNPANARKTAISAFEPAIAVKLIPEGADQEIKVSIDAIKDGREKTSNKTLIVSVSGEEIEKAWLEISTDDKQWKKYGRPVYGSPYMFTMKTENLSEGRASIRCAAQDVWGNIGYSQKTEISISKK